MIEVRWSAYFLDADNIEPFARDVTTPLSDWCNEARYGQAAAEVICEDFFNTEAWTHHIGANDSCITIWLMISEPAPIAGRYRVALELRTKANAQKLLPVIMGAA